MMKNLFIRLKASARRLKKETLTLYFAYRHPLMPWVAKAFSALVVAYALSPIDLIPDFVPVLGYLDDLVLVPLGIYFALKMIPADVIQEARQQAAKAYDANKASSWWVAVLILLLWLGLALLAGFWIADLVGLGGN